MVFSYRETQIVKGMLARGDRQHDIAAYFGVSGGRVGEVASGKCDYPNAQAWPEEKLPPAGPYVSVRTVFEIRTLLRDAIESIRTAGEPSDESRLAVDVLETAIRKL